MLITSKQFHKNNEQKANLELTKHPNYNIYVYTMQIKHYAKKKSRNTGLLSDFKLKSVLD